MPHFSVIIPCYNSERFIRETLNSVLTQTYTDFEIIIVDDGSVDDTRSIIESFDDSRIQYHFQSNRGLSATRNRLIELAKGELIAFLDHDDIWISNKLEQQIKCFNQSPEVMLVYTNGKTVDDAGNIYGNYISSTELHSGQVFGELLARNFIILSSTILKKSVLNEIGMFDESFHVAEEYDLFLRLAHSHAIDYVDEPLTLYRIHENAESRDFNKAFEETARLYDYWLGKTESESDERKFLYKGLFSAYLRCSYYEATRNKNVFKAVRLLWEGTEVFPNRLNSLSHIFSSDMIEKIKRKISLK